MQKEDKDKILILQERVNNGEREAYGEIYRLLGQKLRRYASFKISDAHDLDDIVSLVFAKVFEFVSDNREIGNIRALLYQVMRNAIADYYKSKGRYGQIQASGGEDLLENIASEEKTAEERVDQKILNKAVLDEMELLKSEYQEVVTLRYIEDLDLTEIAFILNRTNMATRVLIHRALKALKKRLEARNIEV